MRTLPRAVTGYAWGHINSKIRRGYFVLPFIEQDDLYEGQGKVLDPQASFKLVGTDSAGNEIRVAGTIEGLAHQAALLLANYKFTRATGGPVDSGVIHLLRSFQSTDPCTPPDCPPTLKVAGTGLSISIMGQPLTSDVEFTEQTGTSFQGFETVAGLRSTIVGTIVDGNFVYIPFGLGRRALVAGQVSGTAPDYFLDATFFRTVVTGAETGPVDIGKLRVRLAQ